jgi:hypothetical protein
MEFYAEGNNIHIAISNRELKKIRKGDVMIKQQVGKVTFSVLNSKNIVNEVKKKHDKSLLVRLLKHVCKA